MLKFSEAEDMVKQIVAMPLNKQMMKKIVGIEQKSLEIKEQMATKLDFNMNLIDPDIFAYQNQIVDKRAQDIEKEQRSNKIYQTMM